MKTYAFAPKDHPTRVDLWCKARGRGFSVINGAWNMNPERDGYVLVWEGEVPNEPIDSYRTRFYNDAIAWIQTQVEEVKR